MNIRELVDLVKRQWKIIVAAVTVAIVLAAAFSFLAAAQYKSTARLFVTTEASRGSNPTADVLFTGQRVKSYAELATAQRVLSRVASRLELETSPTDLKEQIEAYTVTDTVIIELTATGGSAKEAQDLARVTSQELSTYVSSLEGPGSKAGTGASIEISDPASPATGPLTIRTVLNLVVSALLGLLVGVALAIMAARLNGSSFPSRADEELLARESFDGVHKAPAAERRS